MKSQNNSGQGNSVHEISARKATTVVVLFGVTVFLVAALLSHPYGQQLLGVRIDSLSSSANVSQDSATDRGSEQVINCIQAPCPGDEMPPRNDFRIIAPVGGEEIQVGQSMKIRWERANYDSFQAEQVRIYLMQYHECLDATPSCTVRGVAPVVISERTEHDGEFEWIVPSNLSTAFLGPVRIMIEVIDRNETSTSKSFSIVKPAPATPRIISPSATDTWKVGQTYTIKWQIGGFIQTPTVISIAPYSDIQDLQGTVITNRARNSGSYQWTVPSNLTREYYVQPVLIRILMNGVNYTSSPFWLQAESGLPLSIVTNTIPTGASGTFYTYQLAGAGGMAPYEWRLSGGLASGLSIDAATGVISGTPRIGLHRLGVTLVDASGNMVTKTINFQAIGQQTETPHPAGSLVLGLDNIPSSVNLIVEEGGRLLRRPFPNAETFLSHGYKWEHIVRANSGDQALFFSAPMYLAPGTLIRDFQDPRTFYVIYPNNTKRGFTSAEVFRNMGYRFDMAYISRLNDYVAQAPISEVQAHAPGSDVLDASTTGVFHIVSRNARLAYPSAAVRNTWITVNNDYSKVLPINDFDRQIEIVGPVLPRYNKTSR